MHVYNQNESKSELFEEVGYFSAKYLIERYVSFNIFAQLDRPKIFLQHYSFRASPFEIARIRLPICDN